MDAAKGVGIILVVLGHALRGIDSAGLNIPRDFFLFVDRAIYAFHMPLFFFCSGLFLIHQIKRTPPARFFMSRITRLLWPMMLWTWVFFALKLVAGSAQNSAVELSDFPIVPIPPQLHFWFLWALFLMHICAGAVLFVFRDKIDAKAGRLTLLAVALGLAIGPDMVPWSHPYFGAFYGNFGFFLIAVALGPWSSDRFARPVSWGLLVLAVILILLAGTGLGSNLLAVLIILLLCGAISGLDNRAEGDNDSLSVVLRYLGTASLAIYMLHTVFSAAIREAFLAIGILNIPVHVMAGTLVGLLAPLVVLRIVESRNLRGYAGL